MIRDWMQTRQDRKWAKRAQEMTEVRDALRVIAAESARLSDEIARWRNS